MSAITELTGTLYAKLPMEMVGNIYSYCNPVVEQIVDIVEGDEFAEASMKIRLMPFIKKVIESINEKYNTDYTYADVSSYHHEIDYHNENDEEHMIGEGNYLRLFFKDEAYKRQGFLHDLKTNKFDVYVDSYSTHRMKAKEYYEDKLHLITYDMLNEYFGDRFAMSKWIYNKSTSRMDDDETNQFNHSIIEMMMNDEEDIEEVIWETICQEDEHRYNSAIYDGIEGVEIARMEYITDEDDGIPEYYIVPVNK